MFTNFNRVLRFAMQDFSRNKGMSVAAVFVLTVTILLVTGLFMLHGISDFLIASIQNKIDITAYFKPDTSEGSILNVKDQIVKSIPGIESVVYVSQADALSQFTQNHKDDLVLSNALTQVGSNPFLPSLNISTNGDPAQYQQVATILQSDQYGSLIDSVDFSQKKDIIERVFSITSNINKFGIAAGVIMVLIVILVVFNTIKLIIDGSKDEINNMRIVGAGSWFIKSPFLIEGALFGLLACLISLAITVA